MIIAPSDVLAPIGFDSMVGICQSEGVTVSPKWVGDFKTLNDPLPVLVSHSGFVVFGKVVKPNPLRQLEYSRKCLPLCLQQEPANSSNHDCLVQPVMIQELVLPPAFDVTSCLVFCR